MSEYDDEIERLRAKKDFQRQEHERRERKRRDKKLRLQEAKRGEQRLREEYAWRKKKNPLIPPYEEWKSWFFR